MLALWLALAGTAHADGAFNVDDALTDEDKAALQSSLRAGFWRFRRSIALGPIAGGVGLCTLSDTECDGGVSFGLGLYRFDIPVVPTLDMVRTLIERRALDRGKELARAGTPDRAPTQEEIERYAREELMTIKAEVMRELNARKPKLAEKPGWHMLLEGAYLFSSEAWQVRPTIGLGIGPISVGVTSVVHIADNTNLAVGPELGYHLTLGKQTRTIVIDLFARADFAVTGRDELADAISLGVRLGLDIL